jgi:S-formylglutathione hydrolase FrmB
MRARFCVLAISAALAFSTALQAQSRIDCGAMNSRILKHPVRYCVYLPASYDAGAAKDPPQRYPVLYFLHGLGGNEQELFENGGWTQLDELRARRKIGEFLIVAPDAGRTFYIDSANGAVRYSDFFLEEFIPAVEAKYRVSKGRGNRAISGVSMGGYGALRFAFSHPEMFRAVSAQSAALITRTPQEIDASIRSGSPVAKGLADVFGSPIQVAHWRENNPLALAQKNGAELHNLAIYFNCGDDDDFGFEKGAAALHQELKKENVKHEYRAYPGDHSVEYFLSHFDEVIEFHSRAFGLKP